jgi:alpha 1,3-glucosidase
VVAADAGGAAEGQLYIDAGDGYAYRDHGAYALRSYRFANGVLSSVALHASDKFAPPNWLERVEFLGASPPAKVTLSRAGAADEEVGFTYAEGSRTLTLRKPGVPMASDWAITLA